VRQAAEYGLRCGPFFLARELRTGIGVKIWKNRAGASKRCNMSMRHEFAIGPLCDSDLCPGKKARLYYCIECEWRLLVSGSRVAVLNEDGSLIIGEESLRRFNNSEDDPCPVLEAFALAEPRLRTQFDEPGRLPRSQEASTPAWPPSAFTSRS